MADRVATDIDSVISKPKSWDPCQYYVDSLKLKTNANSGALSVPLASAHTWMLLSPSFPGVISCCWSRTIEPKRSFFPSTQLHPFAFLRRVPQTTLTGQVAHTLVPAWSAYTRELSLDFSIPLWVRSVGRLCRTR
jgi:hypothetical protein